MLPSIYTRNSVLILLDASFSPSDLAPVRESTSSIKIIDFFLSLAIENRVLTNLSLSPTYLDTKSELDTLKNSASHSVAQALANKLLPVPGGPYNKIPKIINANI